MDGGIIVKLKIMNSKDLITKEDIWNAVTDIMVEYNFPTENKIANDTYLVYHYYSELESGGHESLLNWGKWDIEKVGIVNYVNDLTSTLESIGANDYATIEKKYGEELWRLFISLENGEVEEDDFYNVIKKADSDYYNLNEELRRLLQIHFENIYTDLIDIEE